MSLCARTGEDRTVMVLQAPADAVITSTTLVEAWSHFG